MKTTHLLAILAIVLVGLPFLATAQDQEILGVDNQAAIGDPLGPPVTGADLEKHTEELTDTMRCPVCQGLSIADSGTMIALAMKEEVRQFIAAGYTDDQILTYFEASYGEFIRLEPKPEGFNLTVWIAPIAVLLLGLLVVIYRLKAKPAESAATKSSKDDLGEYRERVRREISS